MTLDQREFKISWAFYLKHSTKQNKSTFKAAEEAPLIPTPVGFQPECSILDNVSILYLNNKILLELRKTWRFLYSSKTSERDFVELSKSIQYEGPTLIVVRTTNDTILGT